MISWLDAMLVAVMAVLVYRPGYLDGPPDKYEEAIHLSWTHALWKGKLPYRDYYINYGVFYTLLMAWAYAAFGKSLRTHRQAMATGHFVSVVLAYALGSMFVTDWLGRIVLAALLPTLCVCQRYLVSWGGSRMAGGLLVSLVLCAAVLDGSSWMCFWAGGLLGALVFFSQDEALSVLIGAVAWAVLAAWAVPGWDGTVAVGALFVPFCLGLSLAMGLAVALLLRFRLFGTYVHDAILGVVNMGRWRGGLTLPRLGGNWRAILENPGLLLTPTAHFWAAMAVILLLGAALAAMLVAGRPDLRPADTVLVYVFFFGLGHLVTGIRVHTGPQFKSALPAFVILLAYFVGNASLPWPLRLLGGLLGLYLAASSGYAQYLAVHFSPRLVAALGPEPYSGVAMPRPVVRVLRQVEEKVRRLTRPGDEILCLPYDGSSSFFTDRSFYGRHSIGITVTLFDDDPARLVRDLVENPPALVVYEPTAPDLLPTFPWREHLKDVLRILNERYVVVDAVKPVPCSPDESAAIRQLWPWGSLWFAPDGASLNPVFLLQFKK